MSFVELWNAAAEHWWSWAARAVIASTALFGVAAVTWLVIRRRASAHLGHALFLVPLAPFVLPTLGTYALPIHVAPRAESAPPLAAVPAPSLEDVAAPPAFVAAPRAAEPDAPVPDAAHSPSPHAASAAPTVTAWLFAAWLVTASALLARFLHVQLRTGRALRAAPSLGGPGGARVNARLVRLSRRFGLARAPRVVACDEATAPSVWGLRRPRLVLDDAIANGLSDERLDWVLSHELAHVARRDWLTLAFERAVQLVAFFHPLVHCTARLADELREAACDESALARNSRIARRDGASALVQVAAMGLPAPRRELLLTLRNDKTQMKNRILRILDSTRVPAGRSSLTGLALCGALACGSMVQWGFAQETATNAQKVDRAIERSVDWLIQQQDLFGAWSAGPNTEADAGEFNTYGVTGFVLLALDHERRRGAGDDVTGAIERGRFLLRQSQRDDGLFGDEKGTRYMQSHAVATLAWLRTRGDEEGWKPAAERAVQVILDARNPYRGWRFQLRPDGDNDTFTTGLMLAALKEATIAGIDVPLADQSEPLGYIDELTDPVTGRTGYETKGGDDARLWTKREGYPRELTQLSTAMAISTRMAFGEHPAKSEVIRRGAFLLASCAPRWDEEAGTIDYYYWMFGTRALAPVGGEAFEHWKAAVVEALVPHQVPGEAGGWWPAIDAWSHEGESVHATVMCTLALQYAR